MNFSVNHSFFDISGSQAGDLLQGQITVDVEKLENTYKPACICNNKGRVICLFWIKRSKDGFQISILKNLSTSFFNHLKKYLPFYDVQVEESLKKNIAAKEISEWNDYLLDIRIFELTEHLSLKYTPHELKYHENGIIDFKKGCFNGQEVIARMHYRGKLKFSLEKVLNLPNNSKDKFITNKEGKKIGEILLQSGCNGFAFFKNKENCLSSMFIGNQQIELS